MDSYSPAKRKRAVEELLRGRDFANELRRFLLDKSHPPLHDSDDLLRKVFQSFTNTLSILNCDDDAAAAAPHNLALEAAPGTSRCKTEDSVESSSRRGCYKRRKNTHTRSVDGNSWIQDSHAWRKYGQKVILNAKYPRSYFRCTHKFDQGCPASKHVQRIQDNPPLYRTTYYGHHSCKNSTKACEIMVEPTPPEEDMENAVLLSFGSKQDNDQSYYLPCFPAVKREFQWQDKEVKNPPEAPTASKPHELNPSSSDDFLPAAEHEDVISGVNSSSTGGFGMDVMVGSVEFDDVCNFNLDDYYPYSYSYSSY